MSSFSRLALRRKSESDRGSQPAANGLFPFQSPEHYRLVCDLYLNLYYTITRGFPTEERNLDPLTTLCPTSSQLLPLICGHFSLSGQTRISCLRCVTWPPSMLEDCGSQGYGAHFRRLKRVVAILQIYEGNHAHLPLLPWVF